MALSVGRAPQCESNRPHMAAKRDALPPLRRWVTAVGRNEERPKRLVTARRDGHFQRARHGRIILMCGWCRFGGLSDAIDLDNRD